MDQDTPETCLNYNGKIHINIEELLSRLLVEHLEHNSYGTQAE